MKSPFEAGAIVRARGREWVVLPDSHDNILGLRPLGGRDGEVTYLYTPLERDPIVSATFPLPTLQQAGTQTTGFLLQNAVKLAFRSGAGPFRSFGNLAFEPRAYQLVPLMMALKMDTIRLLIADDVGIGKTIEAGLIVRELMDRGEVSCLTVLCPPHLCDQWYRELKEKFHIKAKVVTASTVARIERDLPTGTSLFDVHPVTIVSLDYVKQDRRRDEFLRVCPKFVIVDEAHTCVQSSNTTRHQRFKVLSSLAHQQERHIVMLTATPHSGDEEAFYNLLGLLNQDFYQLHQLSGETRNSLRDKLAQHFVQRRRADIAEWQDQSRFPDRLSREAVYKLSGEYGRLFEDVLNYARKMVEGAEKESVLKQRMNWWAALALLRCISSSPAAAATALRTRMDTFRAGNEEDQINELETIGDETVFDSDLENDLPQNDMLPTALLFEPEKTHPDVPILADFMERIEKLQVAHQDNKLKELIRQIQEIIREGHSPVVFCRYISTAHYVGEHLRAQFNQEKVVVVVITGELAPEEREVKIKGLGEINQRILVATDCLSEGINLQQWFDAVIHYDLSWNPTRHEQREGRVDRFGQLKKTVKTVLLYGENNPIDGAVLRVILRKAERIRKELGVFVPMPDDAKKVMEAVMEGVLFYRGALSTRAHQASLFDSSQIEETVNSKWESARDKARQSHTIFAQRRLKPADVLPAWEKATLCLGNQQDVEPFIRQACERMQAPLERKDGYFHLPLQHLPRALKEQLQNAGFEGDFMKVEFERPMDPCHIHRSHPLVSTFAQYLTEKALDGSSPDLVSRCGAFFTEAVTTRTIVLLLRLRIKLSNIDQNSHHTTLSEEVSVIAIQNTDKPELLRQVDAQKLLAIQPSRNMDLTRRDREIDKAIQTIPTLQPLLTEVAKAHAKQLLEDHRRIREASVARISGYGVTPSLPVDILGLYVLLPTLSF